MAGNNKVTRIAGASLAIALAGVTTLVPVAHAQSSPAPSDASTAPAAPVAGTSTVAPVVATPGSASASSVAVPASATVKSSAPAALPSSTSGKPSDFNWGSVRLAQTVEGGSGSVDAKYTSGDWKFTAVAYNLTTKNLYAISEESEKNKAGQLLRISPRNGRVDALGEVKLKSQKYPITNAAFAADGTMVLFDDKQFYTLDLENESLDAKAKLDFSDPIGFTGDLIGLGETRAWSSAIGEANASKLTSFSVNQRGETLGWTLDTKTGAVTSKSLSAGNDAAPKIKALGNLDYAYAPRDGETVFANAKGETVTVKGNEVMGPGKPAAPKANLVGLTGGEPLDDGLDTAVPSAPANDTTPGTNGEPASKTPPTTTTGAEWIKDIKVEVVTGDDNYPVQGITFKVDGGKVIGAPTDRNGQSEIQLQIKPVPEAGKKIVIEMDSAPKGYERMTATITPEIDGNVPLRFELPRDPKAPNRAQQVLSGINEAQSVISSVAKPLGAAAAIGGAANAGRGTSTRTTSTSTKTTDYTATRMTGRSTSATTGAASRNSGNSNSTGSARVVSSSTTTSASSYSERDDDLADTGTPMRAIISLGVIAMLIGAAYMALGRRREA